MSADRAEKVESAAMSPINRVADVMEVESVQSGVTIMSCEYAPFPGGIATYAVGLANALKHSGKNVTVIGPAYGDTGGEQIAGVFRPLRHHSIPIGAVRQVLAILRKTPSNHYFLAADIRSVLFAHVFQWLHKRPYRAMVHGSEASKFKPGSLLFRLVRRAYLSADAVVFNSKATQSIFHAGIGRPRVEAVTYLGVERWWFEEPASAWDEKSLSALQSSEAVVCCVGRIEPRKGQLDAVRAIAVATERYGLLNPILVIAGRVEDEEYARSVQSEAKALSVNLIMPGRLSDNDVKRLYRAARCNLLLARELPGKVEGFGLVLLEAAAQQCPTVAYASGGIPEVLGTTGILVTEGDVVAAAEAIARYAANNHGREAAGAVASERAHQFTWDRCARETFPELFCGDNALPGACG